MSLRFFDEHAHWDESLVPQSERVLLLVFEATEREDVPMDENGLKVKAALV